MRSYPVSFGPCGLQREYATQVDAAAPLFGRSASSILANTLNSASDIYSTSINLGSVNYVAGENIIKSSSGTDPMLGPLADNGGPTKTHALVAGSPALDAGDNALAVDADDNPLTADQRGLPRIFNDIVDLDSGKVLYTIEHEVRSLRSPLYGRPLVNRNVAQRQPTYQRGRDAFVPGMS